GRPPRTATEMMEWLRRLGDLTPEELEGPRAEFLQELRAGGRAGLIQVPGGRQPDRWILAEGKSPYEAAVGPPPHQEDPRAAGEKILRQFLASHALVGLEDVLERYPFDARWAQEQLEAWSQAGRAVVVPSTDTSTPVRWSEPGNLDQVERASLTML